MNTKITIEDDTNCVVLTLEEAKELYEQLGTLFGKDDTKIEFWGDKQPCKDFDPTKWKDPTTTGPTSGDYDPKKSWSGGITDCFHPEKPYEL